ncbi:lipopolysaccharide biosynthesis protein [Sphaerochaeta sp. S2]|uniref:lipopolysaccharide biosynthesis protein n=1 Tax=Sphaerochaeta sp. S2 TaxID=2798868 RepID=UPI0018E90E9D|nr:lipopolysaccharide biosynthesis protein [Sphaerochaeta sp. S2]MBJ2356837.1 lipopolysaccharide biosynthesis protein [Sphaerochaeta sp. S2]
MNNSIIIRNIIWKFFEIGGRKGIQFVIQIILARLLLPTDYGIVALVVVFITIANVFVNGGLSASVIQKKDVDELDYSSIFFTSLLVAAITYLLLYFSAPWIASFYANTNLISVIRILALTLFPGALNSLQIAIISRKMQFKRLFISNIGAGLLSGIIGISLAYLGYGVYALVFQQLINQTIITIILWFSLKWRPKLGFSILRVRNLFAYGWKILISSLINTLYRDIRGLLIGKIYSPAMLGYYNRGQQFPQVIVANIDSSIKAVMFPALSANQDSLLKIKTMTRRAMKTSSFLLSPILVGMIVIAQPLVRFLLTEKWLPSVPYLQLFCIAYLFWPLQTANIQAIKAIGRSDVFLKCEIIKICFGTALLLISLPFGVIYIALGQVVTELISYFINIYPVKKYISYGYTEQVKDVLPSVMLASIMGVLILQLNRIAFSPIELISLQIICGGGFYFGLAAILKLESFTYLIALTKGFKK